MTNRWLTGIAATALTAGWCDCCAGRRPSDQKGGAAPGVRAAAVHLDRVLRRSVTSAASGAWAAVRRRFLCRLSQQLPGPLGRAIGDSDTGFIGGGQAGYNWQSGAFVIGVETDFDGTSLSKTFNFTSSPFSAVGASPGRHLVGERQGELGLARHDTRATRFRSHARQPPNVIRTGGVAYGGGSSSFNAFDSQRGIFFTGSPSSTRVGWTIGAGAEYAITNNWTIKGEYLYYNLGSTSSRCRPPSRCLRHRLSGC